MKSQKREGESADVTEALRQLRTSGVSLPEIRGAVSHSGWVDLPYQDVAVAEKLEDAGFEVKRTGERASARVCGALMTVDRPALERALSDILRRPVNGNVSQTETSYGYGYSVVRVPHSGLSSKIRGAVARAEGVGRRGEWPLSFKFRGDELDPVQTLATWMAGILARGRTIECGAGVGVFNLRSWTSDMGGGGEVHEDLEQLVSEIDGEAGDDVTAKRRGLVLQPDYQRGYVWTDRQAELFVGHWLEGGEVPKIYVHRPRSAESGGPRWYEQPCEAIDGQQRLRSLWRWVKGEILAETSSGERLAYADTNEVDRRQLDVKICYVSLRYDDRLKLYIRLNRGGTAHTETDIAKARALLDKAAATRRHD